MEQLTIIIPFLNEGAEVLNTLNSIMDNGGHRAGIILINDASEDNYDYESDIKEFDNVTYILHKERSGVAASRDEGVELCETPYFLLLDGHMRFYDDRWIDRIVSELEKDGRQLLCCQTNNLKNVDDVVSSNDENEATAYGAKIDFCNEDKILDVNWVMKEKCSNKEIESVACVLGAAYAASKRYWLYLKGLNGLQYYGSDEAYISMKVWLEGGRCRLLKDIVVGHIYRKAFPYSVDSRYTLYNKLFIAELLLPPDLKAHVFGILQKQKTNVFADSFQLLIENRNLLKELRDWHQKIFTNSFDLIVQLNTSR